ncbi:MAG: phytanoyl-CoA dioxygenase family protein [Deinococcota bacterium]
MSSARLGWLTPSDPNLSLETLKEQYQKQGYLWLKAFFLREDVLAFRKHFFSAFKDTGLLAKGSDPEQGIYSGTAVNPRQSNQILMEIVRSAAFESFCLQPRHWQFYDAFFSGPSYIHKRKLIRYTVPHKASSTGGHYDLVYLRAGTDKLCTSWIPIGDTPVEMGGLVYLEGSDGFGRELEAKFAEQHADLSAEERIRAYNKDMGTGWLSKDLASLADKADTRWLVADYEAGDLMIHSPYMIHAATDNRDSHNHLRLSTDLRFQNVRDEVDVRWSNHWSLDDML